MIDKNFEGFPDYQGDELIACAVTIEEVEGGWLVTMLNKPHDSMITYTAEAALEKATAIVGERGQRHNKHAIMCLAWKLHTSEGKQEVRELEQDLVAKQEAKEQQMKGEEG